MDFVKFNKIARISRDAVVTEKLDGTNGQIVLVSVREAAFDLDWTARWATKVAEDMWMAVGSRNRWITPNDDNYGFARWAWDNHLELAQLGYGRHYGEWWGRGIQRGYGISEKRFSLFNTARWSDAQLPECVSVVPVLWEGIMCTDKIDFVLEALASNGSVAAPGFMNPEGVVIYHVAANKAFKKTLKDDGIPKSMLK